MLQRLKGSSWMVALEETAANLPKINEERSGARSGLIRVPSESQVCLDSNRRPTVVGQQLPVCRWTGRSAGRCPIGCGLRTLSSPQPLVIAVLCLDVSTWFGMRRLLLWIEACCRASAALGFRNSKLAGEVVVWSCPAGEKRHERSKSSDDSGCCGRMRARLGSFSFLTLTRVTPGWSGWGLNRFSLP